MMGEEKTLGFFETMAEKKNPRFFETVARSLRTPEINNIWVSTLVVLVVPVILVCK